MRLIRVALALLIALSIAVGLASALSPVQARVISMSQPGMDGGPCCCPRGDKAPVASTAKCLTCAIAVHANETAPLRGSNFIAVVFNPDDLIGYIQNPPMRPPPIAGCA